MNHPVSEFLLSLEFHKGDECSTIKRRGGSYFLTIKHTLYGSMLARYQNTLEALTHESHKFHDENTFVKIPAGLIDYQGADLDKSYDYGKFVDCYKIGENVYLFSLMLLTQNDLDEELSKLGLAQNDIPDTWW